MKLVIIERLIHDSDIDNWNWVILKRAKEVFQESRDLGISFKENDELVGNLVERILRND